MGGPLSATSIKTPHPLVEAMIEAAAGLGVPRVRDFNTGEQEGAGYYQLTTRHGRRCSTAVAYLRPAEGRPNLRVQTGAHAMAVLFEGRRACGVRYRVDGEVRTLRARREVLLCAGALQSPQLLQLSGSGRRRCCASTASAWCATCRAWARTCRTICRSG